MNNLPCDYNLYCGSMYGVHSYVNNREKAENRFWDMDDSEKVEMAYEMGLESWIAGVLETQKAEEMIQHIEQEMEDEL